VEKATGTPRADEPVLRVRGLVKVYGGARAVDDVSFELRAGEVLTLLGPSGCGKSTTLRMIAGLEAPDEGEVWVRGRLVASAADRVMVPPEGRKVGLVFQSYAIWPHMTVADNIAYPLRVRRIDRGTIASKVADIMRLVRLDGLGGRMATELSGGQQQRVALARALVYEPDLLLLDEPLSNLDSVLRKEMRAQLRALQSRLAMTVLYVTHDQEEAMSLSSRVIVMNEGRIEQIGPPSAVYERPATRFVQDFVGETIRMAGTVAADAKEIAIGRSMIAIAGAQTEALRAGEEIEVALRPEDVVLLSAAAPGAAGVAGHAVEVTYYGDRLECAVRIDGAEDQIVVVTAAKRQSVAAGDPVLLGLDGARITLWQR
jgi:ABC-type Fe3+/spermidine/putrescine transport system ATPase subunit